jgi:UDP-glucose 4-epimerase
MKKKRIVITGVAGFIGSNLAERLLKEGHEVIGIDNLSYGVREQIPDRVIFHELDIRSRDIYPVFEGVDAVFHLAAKNSLIDCQKDPVETADINVRGTVNVFEAASRAKVKKVIYAESSAIYEERALGFYAVSKKACGEFADAYRAVGLTTVALRYFNVYGPRQDYRRTVPPVMSTFIINAILGRPSIIFEGDDKNGRDFINVHDVNDFHVLCLEDERADNGIFDIGTGTAYSIEDIFEEVRELIPGGVEPKREARRSGDPAISTSADIARAAALGWSPRVDIHTGLSEMVEYIKKEIEKGNIK